MKNLLFIFLFLFSFGVSSQTATYNKMIVEEEEYYVTTVMINCGYEINGVYNAVFTFASGNDTSIRQISVTGTGYEKDEDGYTYVYCHNNRGVEFVLLFNADYSYASITRADDEKTIVEYFLEEQTETKPKTNKI